MRYIPRKEELLEAIKWTGENEEEVSKFIKDRMPNKSFNIYNRQVFINEENLKYKPSANIGDYIYYSDTELGKNIGVQIGWLFEERYKIDEKQKNTNNIEKPISSDRKMDWMDI